MIPYLPAIFFLALCVLTAYAAGAQGMEPAHGSNGPVFGLLLVLPWVLGGVALWVRP